MQRWAHYFSLGLLAVTAVVLIALQIKPEGWIVWATGLALLPFAQKQFAKHLLLIYISLGILGLVPINTSVNPSHIAIMGGALSVAVILLSFVSTYAWKENIIQFPLRHGRRWSMREISYIFLTAGIAYLLLPFYLENTGAYKNWSVEPGAWNLFVLFLGTNALGIWDELFFVSSVLALLKKHLSFKWANMLQAVLFTSFLYELGFTGWAPLVIYPFALLQGYIFKQTKSLLYIITIHLTLDFILYLALIDAHHPTWLPIFITG